MQNKIKWKSSYATTIYQNRHMDQIPNSADNAILTSIG